MAAKLYRFIVEHPDLGQVQVVSIGPESATVAAAAAWGVRKEWGQIAAYCDVKRLGPAGKPRCRRCHKEFGEPGAAGSICPDCVRADENFERERRQRFQYHREGGRLGAKREKW